MAKFRPEASTHKLRRSIQPIRPKSAAMQAFRDDLSMLTQNSDYPPPQVSLAFDDEDDCKPEEEDDVALPTPIAMLVTSDGREQPIYQPIPGLEHMFKAPSTQTTSRPSNTHVTASQTSGVSQQGFESPRSPTDSKTAGKATKKSTTLKRSRSSVQGLSHKEPDHSGDEEEGEDGEVVKDKSYTFYIGDIDKLQKFLRQRFNELTMKPLRGIVTNWIRQLEPRRLGAYGKYHEMLPSQMPEDATPPWWPRTIIYKEPSHLKKQDLLTLAVEVIFIHRKIDDIKRRGPWVANLRKVAEYAVETTAPDNFSSSKGSEHSEQMRQRALTAILPSLFEVAQSYEDHIIQYNLYEGSGNVDPGKGRQHTWQAIPRPARQALFRKRVRRHYATPRTPARDQMEYDGSADETAADESRRGSSTVQTPMQQIAVSPPQHVKIDGPCTPIERQQSSQSNVVTPASAFNQSMNSLHIETDEADVKLVEAEPRNVAHTVSHNVQPHIQPHMQPHSPAEMLPYGQSAAYTSCSGMEQGFGGQMFQPMECSYSQAGALPSDGLPASGLPFNHQNAAGYVGQYPMYMTGYPAMGYGFEPTMPGMAGPEYGYSEYSMAGPSY